MGLNHKQHILPSPTFNKGGVTTLRNESKTIYYFSRELKTNYRKKEEKKRKYELLLGSYCFYTLPHDHTKSLWIYTEENNRYYQNGKRKKFPYAWILDLRITL